jgi:hypothetical protein
MVTDPKRVSDLLFYDMPLRRTDVGLVLGCKSVSGTAARQAADLYHDGAIGQIIVSGGLNAGSLIEGVGVIIHRFRTGELQNFFKNAVANDFTTDKKEAHYMFEILKEHNVPERDIVFVDDEARHTGEAFKKCRKALKGFNSASLIAYAPLQRRALGTARYERDLDNVDLQTIPVYPFGINAQNWNVRPVSHFVNQEFQKIDPDNRDSYIGRFCVDPDIKKEVERMSRWPDPKDYNPGL